jgi:hypothetical protein
VFDGKIFVFPSLFPRNFSHPTKIFGTHGLSTKATPFGPDDRKVLKLSPVVKRIAELVRESFSHSFSERMSLSCLISRFSIWRRFELFVFADYMRCCGVENKENFGLDWKHETNQADRILLPTPVG